MAESEIAPTSLPRAPGDRPGADGRPVRELPAGLKAEGAAQPPITSTENVAATDARKEELSREAKKDPTSAPLAVEIETPPELPIPIARLVPKLKKSAKLFAEGKLYVPNASSSLIRVASYDPCPPFIARGKGARIWDEDENEYLDFNLAYGCLINGHAPADQVRAIAEQAEKGIHFAAPTELEIDVAKQFRRLVPSAERVAFCSNGSDATMNAIRIARAVTGK
ncbi:Glutamate-1-semialdehyde 2,1-aminomutase, partial [mine drainage metagenome]